MRMQHVWISPRPEIAAGSSDFKRQAALAEQAANRGRAVGATLVVAQALQLEADAWEHMGQSQKTIERVSDQARALFISAGYRRGAARTMLDDRRSAFRPGRLRRGEEILRRGPSRYFTRSAPRQSIRASARAYREYPLRRGENVNEAEKYYDRPLLV